MKIANYQIDKRHLYWFIPLAALVLGFAGRSLFFYQGFYISPNVPTVEVPHAGQSVSEAEAAPVAAESEMRGTVLVDDSHLNNFRREEFTVLFGRITAAGGQVEFYRADEPLDEALRGARAFIVASNFSSFQPDEVLAVQAFVREGGRLLLMGDPTRLTDPNTLNSIAGAFGVIYQDDYVYNLVENDDSYLNVIFHDFADNPLTDGLSGVVLRAAYSLRVAADDGLVFGDENTYSSLREQPGGVTVVALTTDGKVLALPDQTFLTAPYNTFADNDLFVDHIVSFLLSGERDFNLLDFPNFLSGQTKLVYLNSQFLQDNFADTVTLREALESAGLEVLLDDQYSPDDAMILIADYKDVEPGLRDRLIGDGVRVQLDGDKVVVSDVGELNRDGSALFHLARNDAGEYQLFILVDGNEALRRGIKLLLDGELSACLLKEDTALCTPASLATPTPTPTPTHTPTPTPNGSGTPTPAASPTPGPTATPDGAPSPTPTASNS